MTQQAFAGYQHERLSSSIDCSWYNTSGNQLGSKEYLSLVISSEMIEQDHSIQVASSYASQ
jgi:hypothetical protein